LLGACAAYQPGSFNSRLLPNESNFVGERLSYGCLDMAMTADYADAAEEPSIGLAFGNRCNRDRWIDLRELQVYGEFPGGIRHRLALYDPEAEIRPALLPIRLAGYEQIEVVGGRGAEKLCADVGGLQKEYRGPPVLLCSTLRSAPPPVQAPKPRWAAL
jgi:hypothetical protein